MKFVDEVTIFCKAGNGGAGSRHFRREKFIPYGGPDGGNGGAGGSLILKADRNLSTLLDFRFKPRWFAENGAPGEGNLKDGKWGSNLIIQLPVGTQILDPKTNECIADLSTDQETITLLKGGRGGKGNAFFKSSTNQAPDHAQPGEPGEEAQYRLSLKLVADVGLVGYPNAGKSTFIARVSKAKPKIADYPFTTLTPNLGVVQPTIGLPYVIADIPGIIEGANEGKGLGIRFLKHIERCSILAHLVDPFQLNEKGEAISPQESFEKIRTELKNFSKELTERPYVVFITKMDSQPEQIIIDEAKKYFADKNITCLCISSVSGVQIDEAINFLAQKVKEHKERHFELQDAQKLQDPEMSKDQEQV